MEQFTSIPLVLNGKKVRRVTLASGREFLVAPVRMIVPGVLNGSAGPIYYPPEVVTRNVDDWNGMPLVVYHPSKDGQPVSARTPEILESQEVGRVYNSRASETGDLEGEAWFDAEQARRVDVRVYDDLVANRDIEVSTGLWTHEQPATENAAHNGVAYTHEATFLKPDHLAVLPDQTGACSLRDGCGIRFNQSCDSCKRSRSVPNPHCPDPVHNADKLSHDHLREALNQALHSAYSPRDGDGKPMPEAASYEDHCFVVDVYDKDVVYHRKGKFWKQGYSTDLRKGSVALSEEPPREVRRVTSYKEVTNTSTIPTSGSQWEVTTTLSKQPQFGWEAVPSEEQMNREARIAYITANCSCWNKPEDRKALEVMNDDQIGRLHDSVKKAKETPPPPPPATNTTPPPVINTSAPAQGLTAEQVTQLVEQITTRVINNARSEGEKTHLIGLLTNHILDEAQRASVVASYAALSADQLRPLVALLPPQQHSQPVQNWLGAGGAPPPLVDNSFDPSDTLPETHEWEDWQPVHNTGRNGKKAVKAAADDDE